MKSNLKKRNLIFTYIYLATSCIAGGIGILFIVLIVCQKFGIDIFTHLWVLAIPVALTLLINVGIIELYNKIRKR